MDLYYAQFATGDVVKATGVTHPALQSWIRRGVIVGHPGREIEMPGQSGVRRRFCIFNLLEIAVAKALTDQGVDLSSAFRAAAKFAHTGDEDRLPGMPYPDGNPTYLFVAGDRSCVISWTASTDELMAAIRRQLGTSDCFTALDVGPVFDRVVASVGHHPQAVIDDAYSRFTVRPQVAPSLVHQQ